MEPQGWRLAGRASVSDAAQDGHNLRQTEVQNFGVTALRDEAKSRRSFTYLLGFTDSTIYLLSLALYRSATQETPTERVIYVNTDSTEQKQQLSPLGNTNGRAKKPYVKPMVRHERVFVTTALSCGKVQNSQSGCHLNRKSS